MSLKVVYSSEPHLIWTCMHTFWAIAILLSDGHTLSEDNIVTYDKMQNTIH